VKTDAHWKKIGQRSHHGICLPLSALRSKQSCGIGEFLDLIPLIEWCRSIGFDCLQLLPLNDTGFDPSPYNPLSSCALDPIYLSLKDLPGANGLESFFSLNDTPRLEREAVKQLKMEWLRAYFEKQGCDHAAYRAFASRQTWLSEYARFMAFKEAFQGRHWKEWPSHLEENPQAVAFHSYLQFLCYAQLEKVKAFASERSVFLIGDLPHLLSPDSADVWAHRSLFRLDLHGGAPPDAYNPLGQNWGFPLFDWDAMRSEHYAWWKRRLAALAPFYHIYRIDHVVGLFRIWAIAEGQKASEGSFVPPDPALWASAGREILEMMIGASPLLPIAEDLGTIPPEVYSTLKSLGICGTKVLRWEGETPYDRYEPFSLTTVSTPDMEPLPLWWIRHPDEATRLCARKGWEYEPTLSRERQKEILKDAHHTSSHFHINLLQEYLYLVPELSWEQEERINVPGTLLPTNWAYRFRPFFEEISKNKILIEKISEIKK